MQSCAVRRRKWDSLLINVYICCTVYEAMWNIIFIKNCWLRQTCTKPIHNNTNNKKKNSNENARLILYFLYLSLISAFHFIVFVNSHIPYVLVKMLFFRSKYLLLWLCKCFSIRPLLAKSKSYRELLFGSEKNIFLLCCCSALIYAIKEGMKKKISLCLSVVEYIYHSKMFFFLSSFHLKYKKGTRDVMRVRYTDFFDRKEKKNMYMWSVRKKSRGRAKVTEGKKNIYEII